MVFWHFYAKKEVRSDYVLIPCRIISIASNYRSAPVFQCEITYNGQLKTVTSNSNVMKKEIFVGKDFLMAYSPLLNIAQILITPEDFEEYNMPFPDTLNWVLTYKY